MNQTLVIIPAYNEEENIIKLVEQLRALPISPDVLVVDDGKDRAAEMVRDLQTRDPHVFLIKREGKGGRGSAVLAGIRFGLEKGYRFLVEMDADFSHDPNELPRLMEAATEDIVVIGSRYVRGSKIENWPLKRRIFSRFANVYTGLAFQIGIHDYTNGYRVYGRNAIAKLDMNRIRAVGYIVLSEISYQLYKKGVRFVERPITFVNRTRGGSNLTLKEIKEAFTAVWKIRRANSDL
ncbi:MAG: polyprenol monophosphomannose synthase [Patescibacteria group bacterium]